LALATDIKVAKQYKGNPKSVWQLDAASLEIDAIYEYINKWLNT